jgi:hypothetical protein
MRAVVLHEYGDPEKLKFEDNVPKPQISGSTVLISSRRSRGTEVSAQPTYNQPHPGPWDRYGIVVRRLQRGVEIISVILV